MDSLLLWAFGLLVTAGVYVGLIYGWVRLGRAITTLFLKRTKGATHW